MESPKHVLVMQSYFLLHFLGYTSEIVKYSRMIATLDNWPGTNTVQIPCLSTSALKKVREKEENDVSEHYAGDSNSSFFSIFESNE